MRMLMSCLAGLSLVSVALAAPTTNEKIFRVGFPYVPPQLDSGKVQTAEQYVFLIHLLRPLTSYTSTGDITGDLAESWDISKDFKHYKFQLKKSQKFSNGDEITAFDAAETIKRRMKQNYAVHYDFSKIANVQAKSKYVIEVNLQTPDPFFIYELDHPEFRPLHKSDLVESTGVPAFKITSGFYTLTTKTSNSFTLEANPYNNIGNDGPKKVLMTYLSKNFDPNLDPDIFLKSDFDLIWSPRITDAERLLSAGYISHKPRLGFTYFASLNPESLDEANRKFIQKIMSPDGFDYKDKMRKERAFQLYLPNGPGRIEEKDVQEIWTTIKQSQAPSAKKTNLSILIPAVFEISDSIVKRLSTHGYTPSLVPYKTFEEFAELIRKDRFDIVISNNDFASIDLRGNVAVTFNKERPLILSTKRSKVADMVDAIVVETDKTKRNEMIKNLGKDLLVGGHIIPLYYNEVLVMTKKNIDLTAWSQIVPEIGIWKVKQLNK